MGTWGTRIYEDDTALDLRADFLDGVHSGEGVGALETRLLDEYTENDAPEIKDVALLALACAELESGTLSDKIKAAALEVITSGRQYEHWKQEASAADAGRRKRELTRIKQYLEAYDGTPVKRKSWMALQKTDPAQTVINDDADETSTDKLDDVSWHMQDEIGKESEAEYFARHASGVACMVHWAATRGLLAKRDAGGTKYPSKSLSIFTYIDEHFDGKLFDSDFKAGDARDFVTIYYNGSYYADLILEIQNDRDNYSYILSRKELDAMAKYIDARYAEYKKDPSLFTEQNIEPRRKRTLMQVFLGILMLITICISVVAIIVSVLCFAWLFITSIIGMFYAR